MYMALNPGRSDFPAEPEDGRGKIRPGRRKSRAAGFPDFLPKHFLIKRQVEFLTAQKAQIKIFSRYVSNDLTGIRFTKGNFERSLTLSFFCKEG